MGESATKIVMETIHFPQKDNCIKEAGFLPASFFIENQKKSCIFAPANDIPIYSIVVPDCEVTPQF